MTIRLLPDFAALFLVVFARVGALVMLLPPIAERAVPARVRLALALFLSLAIVPIARPLATVSAADGPAVVGLLLTELLIGAVLGVAARFVLSALQVAGALVSGVLGLSAANTLNPAGGGQDAAIGNFLTLLGVVLLFQADLHHVAIGGIVDSYRLFAPGALPGTGDALALAVAQAGNAFALGVRLAAPFLVLGLVFNLGLGVLSRLMPQLQVYVLSLPASILIGMAVLAVVLTAMMTAFLAAAEAVLTRLAG